MHKIDIKRDYVINLLSGRFIDDKLPNGKVIQKFVPNKINKYPLLEDLVRANPNKSKNEVLIREGLITKNMFFKTLPEGGIEEFKKSTKEKQELKNAKAEHNKFLRDAGFNPKKRLNVTDPDTIYV